MIINLVQNLHEFSVLLLLLGSFIYYRQLRKVKRERKLTSLESTMYVITQLAYILWAGSYLLMILDKN
ncbi:hypothetical protein SAMN05216389_106211 [Oceanobacillus limi]|uniref:Uncharacterized protein n=1 Tax=Oceanobacillus limi TaxID=930131 RepID=A0A1I0CFY8_9BACI|nr:hypothetical protein SAMN05216389_106211 [Oceanobacillus limi]